MAKINIKIPTLHSGQVKIYTGPGRFKAVRCGRRFGKALALETPLPTPGGWTTMGSVQEGDELYDENGNRCRVTGVFDVPGAEAFELRFSDATRITACKDHQWVVYNAALLRRNTAQDWAKVPPMTTGEIRDCIGYYGTNGGLRIPHAKPIAGQHVDGLDGYEMGRSMMTRGMDLDRSILRASAHQRADALIGICDHSGWFDNGRMAYILPFSRNPDLVEPVMELINSLGMSATVRVAPQRKKEKGPFIRFVPNRQIFRTSPKHDRLRLSKGIGLYSRRIVDVRPAPRQHMRCVQVDSPNSMYLAGRQMVPTHNTTLLQTIGEDRLIKGGSVGLFAPQYKYMRESFVKIRSVLSPILTECNMNDMRMRTKTGGLLEGWTLNDVDAGRGGEYDDVLIDEAGVCKAIAIDAWKFGIRPTLMNRRGRAWVFGTPKGIGEDNFFYEISTNPDYGFTQYSAPSGDNPYTPPDEIELIAKTLSPTGVRQEIDAQFVDWSGQAFFAQNSFLILQSDGSFAPPPAPKYDDIVFAVIDATMKGGQEQDGTAVIYFSQNMRGKNYPLTILDWDIVSIEGDLLARWIPGVFQRLDELARRLGTVRGSQGVWIEDKAMGIPLLQAGKRNGWNVHPIDSKLTALGKDARALNASPYVFSGQVKICDQAFFKQTLFKERTTNHLIQQVCSFKVADKDSAKRQDDLLDCLTYGTAISLGNQDGF